MSDTNNPFIADKPMDLHIKHNSGDVLVFKHEVVTACDTCGFPGIGYSCPQAQEKGIRCPGHIADRFRIHVAHIEGEYLNVDDGLGHVVGQFPSPSVLYWCYDLA